MKLTLPVFIAFISLTSCSQPENKKPAVVNTPVADTVARAPEEQDFFPVTAYLKGQLREMEQRGLTPVKYTTIREHTDSAFLKKSDLPAALAPFFSQLIDSSNLRGFYTEKKFMDQTINAVTFSYEPEGKLPDSLHLLRWDVYVDPETEKVKRVFLVQQPDKSTTLQLTWLAGKWCKITTLVNQPDGNTTVEKEEKISWDY